MTIILVDGVEIGRILMDDPPQYVIDAFLKGCGAKQSPSTPEPVRLECGARIAELAAAVKP